MKALSLHITGIVQGVGFRPFVYNLALAHGLSGWVLNSSDGVFCLVQGEPSTVDAFPETLRANAPTMSVIETLIAEEVDPEQLVGFEIRESLSVDGAMTLVSPDIATCAACAAELTDPADRRYGYPFINCTNCGPRFTIIEDVPYDRPLTTMRDFPMCPDCAAEYGDPTNRRFHAQPDACFVCGPRLYLDGAPDAPADWSWSVEREATPRPHRDRERESARSTELLDAAASLLADGKILAIKGLGGFHLACDATNETAVARLRERKNRWGKPLAIMVTDLATAAGYCEIGDAEQELLTGTARPIVLMRRASSRQGERGAPVLKQSSEAAPPAELRAGPPAPPTALAPSVAGDLPEIGVMLPYTPLHHLLLARAGGPLVMTSGNRSEEPIATGNAEALARLSDIADAFLMHDRDIYSRYDDSVFRVVEDVVEPVRRARGYAPHPLVLPFATDIDILAAGPEQKNTFALLTQNYGFVSQHIGDMENAETLEHYERTIALYRRLFRIDPQLVAYDLHPEYLPTKYALGLDLPTVGVQHHHAHIASVTAENGVSDPVIGIALDGTGYGTDGTIWGGEVLVGDWASFERFAHLSQMPMPGGAAAIRRPARMAIGALLACNLLDHPGAAPLRSRLADGEEELLRRMVSQGINTPLTSSMGRLFDAVAAIIGIRDDAAYEGEAAIELEAAADLTRAGSYEFALRDSGPGQAVLIDSTPVLLAILNDVEAGIGDGAISARFHRSVADVIVRIGVFAHERTSIARVALGGGVFLNRLVYGGAVSGLSAAGMVPLTHSRLPVNDGAVSFGQGVVAWARRHGV